MIRIKSLVGHSQVDTACHCLGSLLKHCQDDIKFTIHDDGTLTPQDLDKLNEVLNNPIFIDRKTADEHVLPILQNFPACMKYRKDYTMGLKLFDIYLLHDNTEPLLFCDSDVLFLRPFKFPPPVEKGMAVFMQDSQHAISLRAWDIKPFGPFEIVSRVNTGLINIFATDYDLAEVEGIFSNPKLEFIFRQRYHWIEQTVLAMLATRLSTYLYSPSQITMATAHMKDVAEDQVAIHFVSSYRGNLYKYLDYQVENSEKDFVVLKLQKAPKALAFDVLLNDVKKRIKRR